MKWITRFLFVSSMLVASPSLASAQDSDSPILCGQTYKVASGDTLAAISLRAYGTLDFAPLHQDNIAIIGPDPNRLALGQTLTIPCRGAAASFANTVVEEEPEVATRAAVGESDLLAP